MTLTIEKEIFIRESPEVDSSNHCSFCIKSFREGQQRMKQWLCNHKLHQLCQERFQRMNDHCTACEPGKPIKMRLSEGELERTGDIATGWSLTKILKILNLEERIALKEDQTIDPLPEGIRTIELGSLKIYFPELF